MFKKRHFLNSLNNDLHNQSFVNKKQNKIYLIDTNISKKKYVVKIINKKSYLSFQYKFFFNKLFIP